MDFLDFIYKIAEERRERDFVIKGGPGSGWFAPPKGTHTKGARAGAKRKGAKAKAGKGAKAKISISTKAAKYYTSGAKAIAAGKTSYKELTKKEFVSLYQGLHGWGIGGAIDTFDMGVEFGLDSKELKRAQKVDKRIDALKEKANERLRSLLRQYASDQYSEFSISIARITDSNAADAYEFLINPEKYVKRVKGIA